MLLFSKYEVNIFNRLKPNLGALQKYWKFWIFVCFWGPFTDRLHLCDRGKTEILPEILPNHTRFDGESPNTDFL